MDRYSSLDELFSTNEKLLNRLLRTVYEEKDSIGVQTLLDLLKLQRDKNILELGRINVSESNSLEIAKIQGKIEVIESFLRTLSMDAKMRRGSLGSQDDDDGVPATPHSSLRPQRRNLKIETGILK